ncbi:hypothetical protein [Natrinema sp. H-ect4]|uniref:hypothetical protein n=1 Tax=Natrinema sp. H-ect4 TaxID=3242699 RepID=UPI0035A8CE8B
MTFSKFRVFIFLLLFVSILSPATGFLDSQWSIIESCSATPFCINTTQYNQPQAWTGQFILDDSFTASWMVNATGSRGEWDVRLLSQSTNPNVDNSVSGDQSVEIQQKNIIPNTETVGHPFWVQNGSSNPARCTGSFIDSSSCRFSADINASGANGNYTIFFISNSTNDHVSEETSTKITVKIQEDVGEESPNWFNFQTNASSIYQGEELNISVEARDNESGVSNITLATNESGTWKNYTGRYGSPALFDDVTGEKVEASFIWSNESFNGTLGVKAFTGDAAGNWNSTETREIDVYLSLSEEVNDSVNLSGSTSSYGEFFGSSSAAVSLSEAVSSLASTTEIFEDTLGVSADVEDNVTAFDQVTTPVTVSLEISSLGYTEDNQTDTVPVTGSLDSQATVSDKALDIINVSTEVKVLGISTSETLNSTISLNTDTIGQGIVNEKLSSTISVTVNDITEAVSEHTPITTEVNVNDQKQGQVNASDSSTASIQVNEEVSTYAEKFGELLIPVNVATKTDSQGTASTQLSTDIGLSTTLETGVLVTDYLSSVVDIEEICWAGAPCYQDITGNQTQQQPGGGTGVIGGDDPITIIKPVPIERSLPEWLQIYYQQNRNMIHGFALFFFAVSGIWIARKILRFIL